MTRLVTVIGHGVLLLPHFIDHYIKYVDEICIVVYETENYPTLINDVNKIIMNYDNVSVVRVHQHRIFDWDMVTMLYNYVTNKHPNNWWVVADIDEFHLYPTNSLSTVIWDCERNGWDIVRGGFIDRVGVDGEFPEIVQNKTIWEQFPSAGFFRYPLSKANPNKICVMKGYVELTSGQHYAKIDGHTTWKWQGWNHPLICPDMTVQVHHFKWDKTAIDRIFDVAKLNEDYSYSSEYMVMFKELNKVKGKIDLNKPEYMFELGLIYPEYERYRNWNKLINKITAI
jgi:hypothetical protein